VLCLTIQRLQRSRYYVRRFAQKVLATHRNTLQHTATHHCPATTRCFADYLQYQDFFAQEPHQNRALFLKIRLPGTRTLVSRETSFDVFSTETGTQGEPRHRCHTPHGDEQQEFVEICLLGWLFVLGFAC